MGRPVDVQLGNDTWWVLDSGREIDVSVRDTIFVPALTYPIFMAGRPSEKHSKKKTLM